jgi:hypothetical protein
MAQIIVLIKTGQVGIKEDYSGHIGLLISKHIVVFVPFLLNSDAF